MLGFRHVNSCIQVEFDVWYFQWYVYWAKQIDQKIEIANQKGEDSKHNF